MAMASLACVTIHAQRDDALDGAFGSSIAFGATGWVLTLALLLLISELAMLFLHFLNPSWFNNHYLAFGTMVSINFETGMT